MRADDALEALRVAADPSRLPGMARVGITVNNALGVSIPNVRRIAKRCGTDQQLASDLWSSGIHEARILATLVADRLEITARDLNSWVVDIDSWDVCDFAADLFSHARSFKGAIGRWATSREGFVKRCAFSMIARRAVWAKDSPSREFLDYLPLIAKAALDERNEVKKGVSWALRQIGKRDGELHGAAVEQAERLLRLDSKSARWIARDALKELRSPQVLERLGTG